MKSVWGIGSLVGLVVAVSAITPGRAQNVLGRLESDIRQANGQPETIAAAPRVYLGAIALDDAGRGVRITSIRDGGPAQRAGLRAQDIVVGAAGKHIQFLRDLTAILGGMNPDDHLTLDVLRGARTLRINVVLAAPPGAPRSVEPTIPPPPTGLGAGRTGSIPPPPGEPAAIPSPAAVLPSPADGPALIVPSQPVAPNGPQAQIEELRRRVEQLERRVQELERALAEKQKK